MAETDDWRTDMDEWGLTTAPQRAHHLQRLHDYHRALEARSWLADDRLERIEGWFALTLLAGFVAALLLLWAMP